MELQKPIRKRGVILTPQGWKKLEDATRKSAIKEKSGEKYTFGELSSRTGLSPITVVRVLERQVGVDKHTLDLFFKAFNLKLDRDDYAKPAPDFKGHEGGIINKYRDWGEAVDVSVFYGRAEEITQLEQWVLDDGCRLVGLLGMGGIGKTSLSVKLALKIQDEFEYVIWRSLLHAPPVEDILANLIQFLSNQQETNLPKTIDGRVSRLIDYLRSSRCLLVLDNAEAILQSGDTPQAARSYRAGFYRQGYEGYSELLRRVGEVKHQSCLILTSREKPEEFALLEGETLPVRSLRLTGLNEVEGQEILKAKGLSGTEDERRKLIKCYGGNPLALKIVSTSIRELFDGNISEFLEQGTTVFSGIRNLLDQQFNRLSDFEKQIMYWLAINREPVSLSQLRTQVRLILKPLVDSLLAVYGSNRSIESRLTRILSKLRETSPLEPGYTRGNVFNLLRHMKADLLARDCTSQCCKTLQGHTKTVHSVAFSPDGRKLASGSADQTVRLWDVSTGNCRDILRGHTKPIWSVALSVGASYSPAGYILASGSGDETIKLWDVKTGRCVRTLRAAKPYEGMNITAVTGLTEAQKITLKALGAVEDFEW